jgi:hypothetical protein
MSRLPPLLVACLLVALIAAGCGEGGAEAGARVTIYVSAPLHGAEAAAGRRLCQGARRGVERSGGEAEDLELEVVCLDAAGETGRWTLTRVGANARRATEDSTAVAYVGEPEEGARKQSRPIVDAAGIAAIGGVSGEEAVARVVAAIREGDASEPRQAVFEGEG